MIGLLMLGLSVPTKAQIFGPNADTGVVIGGIIGAVIGHNNGNRVLQGAAIGAGVGMVAGAIIDNNQYHTTQQVYASYPHYPSYPQQSNYPYGHGTVVVYTPVPPPQVVVIQQPVYVHTRPVVHHNTYRRPDVVIYTHDPNTRYNEPVPHIFNKNRGNRR